MLPALPFLQTLCLQVGGRPPPYFDLHEQPGRSACSFRFQDPIPSLFPESLAKGFPVKMLWMA